MSRSLRTRLLAVGGVGVLLLAACEQGSTGGNSIAVSVSPSALPLYVAADQGLCADSLDLEVSQVGYDQSAALFLAGESPLGWESPLDVAKFVSEGEDMVYLSTAGAANMINGVVIRAEDADKYQSIEDLVGKRLGNPGYGTGTWSTFQVVAQSKYGIDAREDFEGVTADSGALLGLLESGEIDAALLFSGQSAAALALDQFETIFSFTEEWQETTGEPMVVNGPVVRQSWLDENEEEAELLVGCIDKAVDWMAEHPDELQADGTYAEWTEAEGWFADEETTRGIIDLVKKREWFLGADVYDSAWIDAMYGLIQDGEGVLVEDVPEKDRVFYPPAKG